MEGSPGLLCHTRAAGSGQGFSALHASSSTVIMQKRAGSRIPQLLLSMQWVGPEHPTQDVELLVVLCNARISLINATTKQNLTLWKTNNLENACSNGPLGYILNTTKLNGRQQIPRSVTQFTCTLYIPLINLGNIRVDLDAPRIRPRGTPRKQYAECILMQVNSLTRFRSSTESAQRTAQSANQSESTGS